MSRRDEREIARGLREVPGGEPPADLLDRLRADLTGGVALREDAAARRRPAALGRRWLLAASVAAMTAAGLLGLHTMEPTGRRSFSAAAIPERAPEAPERSATAAPAAPTAGFPAGAPRPEARYFAAREEAAGGHFDSSPGEASPRPADRAGATVDHLVAPQPDRAVAQGAGVMRLQEELEAKRTVEGNLAAAPSRMASAGAPLFLPGQISTGTNFSREELEKISTARRGRDEPSSPQPSGGVAGGELADPVIVTAESPELRSAVPAAPAVPREAPKAAPPDLLARQRAVAGGGRESATLRESAVADADGEAAQASTPRLWAPEVADLAAAYDDDPPGADGWALAAGGTPPPPKVAGMPVHGPPAGALWVRFRVRALDPALAPAGARVEVAWTPGALRDRRLLGGEAVSGEADVFPLSAGALRRGWTAVYEVRPALLPRASFERLATLKVVTAEGAPLRELALPLSALSRAWMDAPSTLRLPCLAAAFAERRALGAPEGYVDLVAAARSLAVAHGRRDARAATLLELIVRADRVLPASPP